MRRSIAYCSLGCAAFATTFALNGCVSMNPPAENENTNINAPRGEDIVEDSLNNQAPRAAAGADRSIAPGGQVTLDARNSNDPDGDQLNFIWQQVGDGPDVTFESSPFAIITSFNAPMVTETTVLRFNLAVLDGFSASFDEVQVTIAP